MNSQDSIKLALVRAELAAGLIDISIQMTRLDRFIASGADDAAERRHLWRMETEQAGLNARETVIVDRMARRARASVVLVVEDDALVLLSVAADLTAAGFLVIEASNADEAMALLETRDTIGTVFTDVQMPGTMNGLALAQAVHARWPAIKVIVTSGNTHFGLDDLALGDQFIRKPYRVEDVVLALRLN